MYLLHSTITLLVVIAHVYCGTLRQYGPDWLIPKPEPQVDSKRITAKSVFIAPSFQDKNVRCASGFREDASGRCVKLVHVNQAAQLDFLLQRLNAMYGAPGVNSEKQPLQVAVGIPVEPVDIDSTPQTEEMYNPVIVPEGEVSVDLLPGPQEDSQHTSSENTTKDVNFQSVTVKLPLDEADLTTVSPVSGHESKDNETDFIFTPNKEIFQVDEEPLVTLTDIDSEEDEDSVENSTVQASEVELPNTLLSVNSQGAGVMANKMKNTSNVIKKETPLGDSSKSNSTVKMETSVLANHTTANHTMKNTTVESGQIFDKKNEQVSHSSNSSTDVLQTVLTTNLVKSDSGTGNETTDEAPVQNSEVENVTSTNFENVTTFAGSVTSSSTQESSSESSTTEVPTTQQSTTQNSPDQETFIPESTTHVKIAIPALAISESNNQTWETKGDQFENMNNNTNEDDYDFQSQDADVEPELPDYFTSEVTGSDFTDYGVHKGDKVPERVFEGSADESSVPNSNNSVEVDRNNTAVDRVSDNDGVNVVKNGSEVVSNNVGVNTNITSTKTAEKTETTSVVNVPNNNGTNFDELLSASQTVSPGVEIPTNVSRESVVQEVLNADGIVPNVEIRPYEFSETVHNVSQQVPVISPEHSVQVVYPQPIVEVINMKQDPQVPPIYVENHNEPSTVFKESVHPNLPPTSLQFHNLNPIPNLVHTTNFNPLPQMPLVEKAPELPPKYGGYPYPPLPPLNEIRPPNVRPYQRPQYPQNIPNPYQNPPYQQYPPDNLGQNGFVRFPSQPIQTHHQHHIRDEVNTVRFPQENVRSNDKYSRWDNWRFDESRGQRPTQRYWAGGRETQYPQGTNRRNYWVDSRPNRRRPMQN